MIVDILKRCTDILEFSGEVVPSLAMFEDIICLFRLLGSDGKRVAFQDILKDMGAFAQVTEYVLRYIDNYDTKTIKDVRSIDVLVKLLENCFCRRKLQRA